MDGLLSFSSPTGFAEQDSPDEDLASDPLRGINIDAAGGAGKVLRMLAEKVSYVCSLVLAEARVTETCVVFLQTRSEQMPPVGTPPVIHGQLEDRKEGVVAKRKIEQLACELLIPRAASRLCCDRVCLSLMIRTQTMHRISAPAEQRHHSPARL